MRNKNNIQVSLKKAILLFLLYTLTFITIFFFLDMYALFLYNPFFLSAISVLLGAVSTYFHLKNMAKTRIDDLIDKV